VKTKSQVINGRYFMYQVPVVTSVGSVILKGRNIWCGNLSSKSKEV
jgi:hypothetical protein